MNLQDKNLNLIIEKYKDIKTHEQIIKIKENLKDLTQIMKTNIDNVMIRDFKINELLDKTTNLSEQTKEFKNSAIKLNKCCFWW